MEKTQKERAGYYALNKIFGYEPRIAATLVENLGSAAAIFEMEDKDLDILLGPYSRYRKHIGPEILEKSAEELHKMEASGMKFITMEDECFPQNLKECSDCPSGLFIRSGSAPEEILSGAIFISVVGTRDISFYGREWGRRIVEAMASCREKPVIVSGLAIGSDITAHLAALECGLPTIGILPCGISDIYPPRHRGYAAQIASAPKSALITDFPPGTAPTASTFLRRNRIIAGLSYATIVIESKVKGGAMITANLAFSYGRDVYALPGRADDLRSLGCNYLIKNRIAEAVFDENELIESLKLDGRYRRREFDWKGIIGRYAETMDEPMLSRTSAVLKTIKDHRGICMDELSSALEMEYKEIAVITGILENDGIIKIDLMQRCVISV